LNEVFKAQDYTNDFKEILYIINEGRRRAVVSINYALIDTYWNIGRYLSIKTNDSGWGKSVVKNLSEWILQNDPYSKGYSPQNIWRMKQFYETYSDDTKLSPMVRELSWTNHLIIIGQCKTNEEKLFYIQKAISGNWSKRELERQIAGGSYERTSLFDIKLSPAVREYPKNVSGIFKDSYMVDFVSLPKSTKNGICRKL
jgi:predicted nuclease of restriction endonuclease-like (RecB) superfamily